MKPVVLLILDGYGYREEKHGNAIYSAKTDNFDMLWKKYPHSTLEACGSLVGLPKDGLGGSEVGHMNIGAGRIVYQPLALIDKYIEEGKFFSNNVLLKAIKHVKTNNSKLHLYGLLSDYGIHSMDSHLFALLKMAHNNGVEKVCFHLCTDGRDASPYTALKYIEKLQKEINKYGIGKIATIGGRYYAMDRDNKWDRVKLGYDAIVNGIGNKYNSALEGINSSYKNGITDEFIIPFIVDNNGMIEENDAFIDFNFRKDREVELLKSLTEEKFGEFKTKKFNNLNVSSFMFVSDEIKVPYAFKLDELFNTLGEYLADKHIFQLRLAETEKYVYVTSVFDGMKEKTLPYCDQILISSPKVKTFDLKPEMSVYEVTDTFLKKMDEEKYDFVVINFANPDMVGHTGNFNATIEAINHVDICLGKVYNKVKEKDGLLLITADHGNADVMLDEDNKPVVSHSYSLVPFILCKEEETLKNGKLGDIAPTILKLLNIKIPDEMTGNILIEEER